MTLATPEDFRSGFVALIGRPNVGKSTLVNRLVGEKVAITSPVAQTTRNRLRAIVTTDAAQLVLVDTPGIHKPHHLLGERLVQSARSAIGEVDLVLLLLEGFERPGRGDAFIVNLLREQRLPVLVALSKWDRVPDGQEDSAEQTYRDLLTAPIGRCGVAVPWRVMAAGISRRRWRGVCRRVRCCIRRRWSVISRSGCCWRN